MNTYNLFLNLLNTHGYFAIFIIIFIIEVGVPLPIPSEFILLYAGYRIAHGKLDFVHVAITSVIADFLGATILFLVCYWLGEIFTSKLGHWFNINQHKIEAWEKRFSKSGGYLILVLRFIPFVRLYVTAFSGLLEFSPGIFIPVTFFGSISWTLITLYLGIRISPYFGKALVLIDTYRFVPTLISLGFLLLIAAYIITAIRRRQKKS